MTLMLCGGNIAFVGFALFLFAREFRFASVKGSGNSSVRVLPGSSASTSSTSTAALPPAPPAPPPSLATATTTRLVQERRQSTIMKADRLHAEHLEYERQLQSSTVKKMEKQRRRTQNRVKARALLRQSEVLHRVEIFRDLDQAMIQNLIDKMSYESLKVGTKLVKEGDVANELFVIMRGKCGVYHEGLRIHTLSKFDIFGESALIIQDAGEEDEDNNTARRNATVIAESDPTQVLKLSRKSFLSLLGSGNLAGSDGENCVLERVRTVSLIRANENRARLQGRAPQTKRSGPKVN